MPSSPRPESTTELDVLARPGANDQVLEKKVLLAHLAHAEAARLGVTPAESEIRALADAYCRDLGLDGPQAVADWLREAGIEATEFTAVIGDYAATLAVQAHHRAALAQRVAVHRRLTHARGQRLARLEQDGR